MKKKWKYDNCIINQRLIIFIEFLAISFILSCNTIEKQTSSYEFDIKNLDNLIKPVNQFVFSNVNTVTPEFKLITPRRMASGVIAYNPKLINNISARFDGRIEKLYIRYNYQKVKQGQRIMDIYSPDILSEQQNLLFLINNNPLDSLLIESSKQKLRLLGLTEKQLNQIEKSQHPINPLPVYSPYSGHIQDIGIRNGIPSSSSVMNSGMTNSSEITSIQLKTEYPALPLTSELTIKEGMYLQSGQAVFAVFDISQVWALLHIFQKDAAYIHLNDQVFIVSENDPKDTIIAHINYIEPVVWQNTTTLQARVYLSNVKNQLHKIGTLISAQIQSAAIKGMWIPKTAIVNLGKKQIIFLKSESHFIAKEIQTGFENDTIFQVISGLIGNEEIAENAQFLVDSESFIKTESNEK